jgi:hypothetical protein
MQNVKNITIDCDNASNITAVMNPVTQNLNMYAGTQYIIQANCYCNSIYTDFKSFDAGDTFELQMGNTYGTSANPILIESNTSCWNQVADWANVNVAGGQICVKINTNGTALNLDLANSSSKEYITEIWLTNNIGDKVLIMQSDTTIYNTLEI